MSFQPYSIYSPQLPILRPGHYINIGAKYFIIVVARRGRPFKDLAANQTTKKALNVADAAANADIAGNITVGRVINLQYASISGAGDIHLFWLEDPLMSKWVDDVLNTTLAPMTNPLIIDRYTYSDEMHMKYISGATVPDIYLDLVEYQVAEVTETPSMYLQILPTGQATFIESEATAEAMRNFRETLKSADKKAGQKLKTLG